VRAAPEDEAEWAALEGAASALKAARDKAVAALASAHADIDRVSVEVGALTAALAASRQAARDFEGAAAEAAGRADWLADLLEESALATSAPSSEAALATERARCGRLEATITALCLEVGRAGALSAGVACAVLPALAEVEERLGGVAFPTAASAEAVPVSR
jgi:hypothetical protein